MNEIWQALANEAETAADHLAVGATALGRANYAERGYYSQSFFALSVGLERSCKLILMLDHAVSEGDFPSEKKMRRFGHNLSELLDAADEVAGRLQQSDEARLPRSEVHQGIVTTLSNFATNVTRYYNLDVLTGASGVEGREDPIVEWIRRVTQPVLERHYTSRAERGHLENAAAMEAVAGPYMMVRFFTEDGILIDSPGAMSMRMAETEFARRWERMYVLQLARFVGSLLGDLGYLGTATHEIPHLSEYFGIFRNSDRYFRERKTWSIRGR
ncbi:MAG TPA: hypothetical protein VFN18_10430 [Solirubrobacterales bacterium]|nr:hypothetical protein [Solirubrobacterales bacterium]